MVHLNSCLVSDLSSRVFFAFWTLLSTLYLLQDWGITSLSLYSLNLDLAFYTWALSNLSIKHSPYLCVSVWLSVRTPVCLSGCLSFTFYCITDGLSVYCGGSLHSTHRSWTRVALTHEQAARNVITHDLECLESRNVVIYKGGAHPVPSLLLSSVPDTTLLCPTPYLSASPALSRRVPLTLLHFNPVYLDHLLLRARLSSRTALNPY